MKTNQRLFSEEGLSKFDGTDPDKPIYLAVCSTHLPLEYATNLLLFLQIDHDVYDVSEGKRTYGPGGSYHFMYASII